MCAKALVLALFLLADDPMPPLTETWYGVSVKGERVGWSRISVGRREDGVLVHAQFLRAVLPLGGERIELVVEEQAEYGRDAPHALLGATRTVRKGTEAEDSSLDAAPHSFEEVLALSRWAARPRQKGDRLEIRTLDIRNRGVFEGECVVDRVTPDGLEVRLGNGTRVELDREGMLTRSRRRSGIEFRRMTKAEALRPGDSPDLATLLTVSVDRPLGPTNEIRELVLEATGDGFERIVEDPGQGVDRKAQRLRLTGPGRPGSPAGPEECILRDPHEEMRKVARGIVGHEDRGRVMVELMVRFVSETIEDAPVRSAGSTALEVLKNRKGDCTEHAQLFIALANAAGMRARSVNGLMYLGDDRRAFGAHVWCEVVLDGRWIQVDPTWNQMEIDATHIRVKGRAWDLGTLQFRVVKLVRDD